MCVMGYITTLCKILVTSETGGLDRIAKVCYRFIYGHTRAQVPKGSLLEDKEAARSQARRRSCFKSTSVDFFILRGDEWR